MINLDSDNQPVASTLAFIEAKHSRLRHTVCGAAREILQRVPQQ
ncbi:hypothetical protein [Pseudoxanthomonas sp. GM95]|nr:hypothetical protein [Pseudoxanthomonas sp. GM95]